MGLAFVLLVAALWVGEGSPNLQEAPPLELLQHLLFVVVPLGFVVGWKWERVGGVVSLCALAGFYVVNFAQAGSFPGGWIFPAMACPGVLFLVCSVRQRKHRPEDIAPQSAD